MSLMGNLSAWGAPLIGLGGWDRYTKNAYTGERLEIPKDSGGEHGSGDDFTPMTIRDEDPIEESTNVMTAS